MAPVTSSAPFTDEARRRMTAYLAANPRGQYGVHRYSLEDFGLTRAAQAPLFAEYCERFRIPIAASSPS